MKLAHLDWNICESLEQTAPSVHYNGLDNKSQPFQLLAQLPIDGGIFCFRYFPEQVLLEMRGSDDCYAESSFYKSHVSNDDNRTRIDCWLSDLVAIQLFLHPFLAVLIFFRQLFQRLSFPDIFFPKEFLQGRFSGFC